MRFILLSYLLFANNNFLWFRWKRQHDGGLLLHDSKAEDSGNYSCRASNIHGTDRVTYRLVVMGEGTECKVCILT